MKNLQIPTLSFRPRDRVLDRQSLTVCLYIKKTGQQPWWYRDGVGLCIWISCTAVNGIYRFWTRIIFHSINRLIWFDSSSNYGQLISFLFMLHIRVTTVFGNKANTASLEQVRMIRQLGNSNESTNTHCDLKKIHHALKYVTGSLLFFFFLNCFFKILFFQQIFVEICWKTFCCTPSSS